MLSNIPFYGERMKKMTEEKTKERVGTDKAVLHEQSSMIPHEMQAEDWLYHFRKWYELLLVAFAGFFFGGTSLPLAVYPLGCALVAALPKHSLIALLGIWLRCFYELAKGENITMYGACATAILICRVVLCMLLYGKDIFKRVHRLHDTVFMRVLLCVALMLTFSLVDILREGITLSLALGMMLSAIAAAAFSFLYCFFFEEEHKGSPAFEAGLGAVAFSAALAFAPFAIGEFSLGITAAFAITLYVGYLGSPTRSSAVGLLCGLALGGYFAPVLALAGLIAGIFSEVHAILSGVAAVLVSVCGTLYFGGANGVLTMLPEVLFSAFMMTILVCLGLLQTEHTKKEENQEDAAIGEMLTRRRDAERERRMNSISNSMNALSGVIRGFSEKFRRPEPKKLTEKCKAIWETHCKNCPNECTCRGLSELETERISNKLASRLMSTGKIDRERLYEITKIRCPDLDTIAAQISALSAHMLEEAIREDKTRVFAMDYEAMAQMFADAAAEGDMRLTVDKILSDRLRRALAKAGFHAENVVVCGDRKKFIIATGEGVTHSSLSPSDIHTICEEACGVRFSAPAFMLEKGNSALTLESVPLFSVETASQQLAKKGENVCGDSISSVQNYDGYYYTFLCDGMGSGEDAALTSHLCSIFLEKMLSCGNKKAITLEMLNHFLTSRTTECFATVDLVEIDLVLGVASFLKSGAVPSYVVRNRHLYKIASGTFPIGILPEVSVEVTEFELCDGDVILICSDGVSSDIETQENENPQWFVDFISREWTDDLDAMAEKIIHAASSAGEKADDMTVELIRVHKHIED